MSSINFELQGLSSLREELSKTALDKKLVTAIGLISTELHSSLRFAVRKEYAINKSLDSVLVNRTSSRFKTGTNFIESGLEYIDSDLRLAEFPTETFLGNINPGAKRPGVVAKVTIKRGKPKIIYGKLHHGGFLRTPSNSSVTRRNIFERQSSKRFPIKPLYAIGLAKMASIMYDYNPDVRIIKRKLEQEIINIL